MSAKANNCVRIVGSCALLGGFLASLAAAEKEVAKRRLAAINRTTQLTPHLGNAQELREQWETMTLSRQKEIVGALLQHVVVGPARRGFNRFDPARLSAVWRY